MLSIAQLTVAAAETAPPAPSLWATGALLVGAIFAIGSSLYRRRGRHRR